MSINCYKPHVILVPEDDANRQLADGFILHEAVLTRAIQVVPPAGGWSRVLDVFEEAYINWLRNYPNAHVVLLIDFDGHPERRNEFAARTPADVASRVYVLGTLYTPEELKRDLQLNWEDIGKVLAHECVGDTPHTWQHQHLRHNEQDRIRLANTVGTFLFQA